MPSSGASSKSTPPQATLVCLWVLLGSHPALPTLITSSVYCSVHPAYPLAWKGEGGPGRTSCSNQCPSLNSFRVLQLCSAISFSLRPSLVLYLKSQPPESLSSSLLPQCSYVVIHSITYLFIALVFLEFECVSHVPVGTLMDSRCALLGWFTAGVLSQLNGSTSCCKTLKKLLCHSETHVPLCNEGHDSSDFLRLREDAVSP